MTQNLENLLDAKFLEKQSFSSSHVKRAQSQGFDPDQTPSLKFGGLNLLNKFDKFHNIATLISAENAAGNIGIGGGGPSDFNKDDNDTEDGGVESCSSSSEEDEIVDEGADEEY